MRTKTAWTFCLLLLGGLSGCWGKNERPPATTSGPPPPIATTRPQPVERPPSTSGTESIEEADDDTLLSAMEDPDNIYTRSLEEINADPPLEDVHFDFDSAVLREEARRVLDSHADWLKRYATVTLLVEGHCDERGTVEYNLALGERRANAAYSYLVSLGIPASRLKTISYGKEFPLDPGHDEAAWSRNRRAHFEITAK